MQLFIRFFIVAVSVMISACHAFTSVRDDAVLPLTADAFVSAVSHNAIDGTYTTQVVMRPYSAVKRQLATVNYQCFNRRVRHSPLDGVRDRVAFSDLTSVTNAIDDKHTQISLQEKYNNKSSSKMPQYGKYVLVADVKAITKDKTEVSLYATGVGQQTVTTLQQAAQQGAKVRCPVLRIISAN